MTNIIPFVPRIVERAEEEMPRQIKIDWANFEPVFSIKQIEAGGFADIEGLVPMEIALLMLERIQSYKTKRATASQAKRKTGKKKRTI